LEPIASPQAVDGLALAALFQMISPRIKKPIACMCWMMWLCKGI
jgi:hypothetical protein